LVKNIFLPTKPKQVEHNLEDFTGSGKDTLDEANSSAFRFIFEDLLRPDLSI